MLGIAGGGELAVGDGEVDATVCVAVGGAEVGVPADVVVVRPVSVVWLGDDAAVCVVCAALELVWAVCVAPPLVATLTRLGASA
ncbi:MAG: hypothetical protein RXR06_10710 [Thermoproteus sp.]